MCPKNSFPPIQWEDDDTDDLMEEQEPKESKDFAALLADNQPASGGRPNLRPGQKIQGVISHTSEHSQDILVDLGHGFSGILERQDWHQQGQPELPQLGSPIEAFVVSRRGDEILLSMNKSKALKDSDDLYQAYREAIPIKGKVSAINKGGFEVTVVGKKAFCPVSQMELRFVEQPSIYLNKELEFFIEKIEEGGRNILLSRARLLKQLAQRRLVDLEQQPSDTLIDATITKLADFGAFADLGDGLEGLIHVSQIGFQRIDRPSDVLKVGEKVRVAIIKIDRSSEHVRISLSLKASLDDPWETVDERYKVAEAFPAQVIRFVKNAAIVELEPGIEAILPGSEMSWAKGRQDPQSIMKVGEQLKVQILSIQLEERRMSVSLRDKEHDPWKKAAETLAPGQKATARVVSLKNFGAIAEIESGIEGLVPVALLRQKFGESYRKAASPGKELEVIVADLDSEHQRLRFGLAGLEQEDQHQRDYQEYLKEQQLVQKTQHSAPNKDAELGSFGKLLAAKLNRPV